MVLRNRLRSENGGKLRWLRNQRFGSDELNRESVFNLSQLKLTPTQLEVLSRGPKFGIPPGSIGKEEVFSEFEMYYQQVVSSMKLSTSEDMKDAFRSKLTSLAHDFAKVKQDRFSFPLGREHLEAVRELRQNRDIVITRPDKGAGTVLLDQSDYNKKMLDILNDKTKFECLGSCAECDKTGQNERALQAFLLRKVREGKLDAEVYDRIRPSGSMRPRLYGLPKVHKPDPIPLRPILSMVGSAQHEMARWLGELLKPVVGKYSSHVVSDSFCFSDIIRGLAGPKRNAFMCSFDVKSLFTNVPIDETIKICLDTLYRSKDITPPCIDESLLKKLLQKCTVGVEFSFNNLMYRQVDGVAMGSPLGPILANVFLGYCETRIAPDEWPELYRRYVDDTFSLFSGGKAEALKFLARLNSLHPSLQFTMESEDEGKLPFMDVLVMREVNRYTTTIHRKPTFTGLYTRWDSYCAKERKIALMRSLASRAKRICSPEHLDNEVNTLKSIFQSNGYPPSIIECVITDTLTKLPVHTVERKPLYLRLPWLGAVSLSFKHRIEQATVKVVPWCKLNLSYTSRDMFNTTRKDVLSAEHISNVVYLFDCECTRSYVGRTAQHLGERIGQHVPNDLVVAANIDVKEVSSRGRSKGNELLPVSANPDPRPQPVALRTRSKACVAALTVPYQQDLSGLSKTLAALQERKTDTAITRHLKNSPACLSAVCADVTRRFSILARARNACHLATLEAIFIARKKPELCNQKSHVKSLSLF